ncbi:MAG: TIGR04222 domain-containing membrane protein [Anaerolineae bacterium]|nr:TIGR04222 domain-containing membrane protein [Phycisphaerae bacterium]
MVALGSVFDLRGAEFLRLYRVLLLLAALVAIVLRWLMRSPGASGVDDASTARAFARDLDPYEIAYLTGGLSTASAAAMATLVHRGMVSTRHGLLRVNGGGMLINDLHPLERAVYSAIDGDSSVTPRKLREYVSATFRPDRLESRELVLSGAKGAAIRVVSALPLVTVLTIGLIKISVGLSRNRPVAFLVILSIVTAIVAGVFMCKTLLRTRRGDAVVRALRSKNAALRTSAGSRPKNLALDDLTMACALFGPVVFSSAGDAEYRDLSRKFAPVQNSSGCGSGSSCGGGSSGGGGCGGGGCGGCGGS